jgi:hypothetical protein
MGPTISFLKEDVLQICFAHKNPSPSAGFEPANLGSNGKHANQYTRDEEELFE